MRNIVFAVVYKKILYLISASVAEESKMSISERLPEVGLNETTI